ncbi:CoA transferase [Williamsia sp. 1138]|uniref:CaiB/BaiF CoA transferase family protein n=1 Tax=Williamsia sp. 1138 TaxID=1903117 RepID=UPI00117F6052|nr:CoA transferase [Williamsia sp. 1138]
MTGGYSGLRVLDLSQVIAGPFCTRLLSDLGADVIRIESRAGDIMRRLPIGYGTDLSTAFAQYNVGKRSVGIDLKSPAGLELALQLAEQSDLVVENFRPGTLDRLGLGYSALQERNSRIVLCSIGLFGSTGPYSQMSGHGMVAEAYSGLMSLTGNDGGPFTHFGTPLGDMNAAVHAVAAIGSALYQREQTGQGSHVDISSFDALFAMIDQAVGQAVFTGGEREYGRYGSKHPQTVPSGVLTTNSGAAVTFSAVGDGPWGTLAALIGRPELADDPRFVDIESRIANREELYEILDNWALRFGTADDLVAALSAAGLPAARIRSVAENVSDPHLIERGTLAPVDMGGGTGEKLVQSAPYVISGADVRPQSPPPHIGEHTSQVLTELLRLPQSELDELYAAGTIYTSN